MPARDSQTSYSRFYAPEIFYFFFPYVKLKISWVFILGAVELADVGISVKVSDSVMLLFSLFDSFCVITPEMLSFCSAKYVSLVYSVFQEVLSLKSMTRTSWSTAVEAYSSEDTSNIALLVAPKSYFSLPPSMPFTLQCLVLVDRHWDFLLLEVTEGNV